MANNDSSHPQTFSPSTLYDELNPMNLDSPIYNPQYPNIPLVQPNLPKPPIDITIPTPGNTEHVQATITTTPNFVLIEPHLPQQGVEEKNFSTPISRPPRSTVLGLEATKTQKLRGRPRGFRNRRRDMETNNDNKVFVLEIPSGLDLVKEIQRFAQSRDSAISIHSGVGRVTNVMVRSGERLEPDIPNGEVHDLYMIHGILVGSAIPSPPINHVGSGHGSNPCGLVVILNSPIKGIWGGYVTGPLMTASTVLLYVSLFGQFEFCRLVSPDGPDRTYYPGTSGNGEEIESEQEPGAKL